VSVDGLSFGNKITYIAGQINLFASMLQMIWQSHVSLAATSKWASQGFITGALLLMWLKILILKLFWTVLALENWVVQRFYDYRINACCLNKRLFAMWADVFDFLPVIDTILTAELAALIALNKTFFNKV